MMTSIKKNDVVVWHTYQGDKVFRVLHVYDDEPKMLLVTDNIDDEMGFGNCFHAPTQDCVFLREGEDVTASQRGKNRTQHGTLPHNLIKVNPMREDE